jgi:hypothetical protein
LRGPPPDRAWWVPDPSRSRRLVGASSPRLVLRLRSPRHRRWVVRADGSASCLHPQGVPRLLVCRTPYLGSVLHARMRVHQSLAHARCPIVCTSLSHHPSAAPPALQELLYQSLQALIASLTALIAFESVPSSRAGSPSPATRPVRALRRGVAPGGAGRLGHALVGCSPGWAARGVRADARRGHQREQSGMGWADAVGGKGRLIFLYSPAC